MYFQIYDVESGGVAIWGENHTAGVPVNVSVGVFDVILGSINALTLPFDVDYWLSVIIDGELLTPRVRMASTPYSLNARNASTIDCIGCIGSDQIDNTTVQSRVTGTCGPGNSIRVIDADGQVTCEPDNGAGTLSCTDTSITDGTSCSTQCSNIGSYLCVSAGVQSTDQMTRCSVTTGTRDCRCCKVT